MLITFEGLNSCGKSTQIDLLANHLLGYQSWTGNPSDPAPNPIALVTAQPSSLGAEIRQATIDREDITPLARLLLFQADRAQHVATVLRPALAEGKTILCDRYTDSTLAYQHWGDGIDVAQISALNWMTTGGLIPDLTFFIDTSVATCLERSADRRDISARHQRDTGYYERVKTGFLQLARINPDRIVTINGNCSIDKTFDQIVRHIENFTRKLL
jgi:dTMP kinase